MIARALFGPIPETLTNRKTVAFLLANQIHTEDAHLHVLPDGHKFLFLI